MLQAKALKSLIGRAAQAAGQQAKPLTRLYALQKHRAMVPLSGVQAARRTSSVYRANVALKKAAAKEAAAGGAALRTAAGVRTTGAPVATKAVKPAVAKAEVRAATHNPQHGSWSGTKIKYGGTYTIKVNGRSVVGTVVGIGTTGTESVFSVRVKDSGALVLRKERDLKPVVAAAAETVGGFKVGDYVYTGPSTLMSGAGQTAAQYEGAVVEIDRGRRTVRVRTAHGTSWYSVSEISRTSRPSGVETTVAKAAKVTAPARTTGPIPVGSPVVAGYQEKRGVLVGYSSDGHAIVDVDGLGRKTYFTSQIRISPSVGRRKQAAVDSAQTTSLTLAVKQARAETLVYRGLDMDGQKTANGIRFSTRAGWDGGDSPSAEAIAQAREAKKAILREFPEAKVNVEAVDEWVDIDVEF